MRTSLLFYFKSKRVEKKKKSSKYKPIAISQIWKIRRWDFVANSLVGLFKLAVTKSTIKIVLILNRSTASTEKNNYKREI